MNFCPTIKIFRESETSQQDGPYGQLLDVSQDVFTCDSAKVQKSPKTPPPLVPPRTFIRGSFFENRPSKTVSLQNKQTNKQNQTLLWRRKPLTRVRLPSQPPQAPLSLSSRRACVCLDLFRENTKQLGNFRW